MARDRLGKARGPLRLAGKELRDVLRERSIVVALLVQFFIAAFSAFLAVGLMALYDPESAQAPQLRATVAFVGEGGGFGDYLEAERNLVVRAAGEAQAYDGFQRGQYRAIVQELRNGTEGVRTVTVVLPDGHLQTTLLVTQFKALLKEYEADLRVERQDRLEHRLQHVEVPEDRRAVPYAFLYATLLPLLLMTPVFLSGAIAADSLSGELQSRTLTLLRASPMSLPAILAGKLLVPLLLAPLQFLLWTGLLWLNGIPVQNLPLLALLAMLLTLVLAGVGYALAARLRRDGPTQATYALAAIALGAVSLLLPRDPMNVIALAATGQVDAASGATIGIIAVLAAAACIVGFGDAARSIRRKPD